VTAAEAAGLVALLAPYYPQIVPPSVTLYSPAASRETLAFLVIAIGVLGPVTIAYHAYANWVFRGRQPLDDGTARPGCCAVPGHLAGVPLKEAADKRDLAPA
jgi:cytochrome bd-type quinol oxidase subunit 2